MQEKQAKSGETTAERHHAAAEVLNGFRRILRALRIASGETQASVGLSAAQLFVLGQLGRGQVLSINELAERTLTDRSSVAAVVERLVAKRLVARSRAAEDRRRAAIHITAAGRRLLRSAPAPPTERLIAGLAALEPEELQQLARLMSRLVDAMGLEAAPATMLFEGEQSAVAVSLRDAYNESRIRDGSNVALASRNEAERVLCQSEREFSQPSSAAGYSQLPSR